MLKRIVSPVPAALALLLVLLAAGTAHAATVTFEPAREVSLFSLGRINVAGVSCEVTFVMTLRTEAISKVNGEHIGSVTNMVIACGTTATARLEVPWEIRFNSITGTLPSGLTGFLGTISRVKIASIGAILNCLYEGTLGVSFTPTAGANPYTVGLAQILGEELPRFSGGFLCPDEIFLAEGYRVSPQQRLTRA